MKNLIKKLLRENLNEISNKPLFGSGDYHEVYRFNKYPNRLFKIGTKKVVAQWVGIFKSNPMYFPKVYRVFEYKKDPLYSVVEIEMLDTKKASDEFTKLNDYLESKFDILDCNDNLITFDNFHENPCFTKFMDFVEENNPELTELFIKWAEFLQEVTPIVESNKKGFLDLHARNVAYDNQGNLKMIDI